jgi:hypothetical protein
MSKSEVQYSKILVGTDKDLQVKVQQELLDLGFVWSGNRPNDIRTDLNVVIVFVHKDTFAYYMTEPHLKYILTKILQINLYHYVNNKVHTRGN